MNPTRPSIQAYLPLKPELFQLLLALVDQDLHGYAIMKEVERNTQGRISLSPSPLYRRLKRLMDDGVVAETDPAPDEPSDDERRRYYRLTPLGMEIIRAEARRIMELTTDERVRRLAGQSPDPTHA